MKLSWNSLSFDARRNGIITGYSIRYAVKESMPKVWLHHDVNNAMSRIETLADLKKYTVYEFTVAAKTSKGAGVYSPIVEMRTKEDGMC